MSSALAKTEVARALLALGTPAVQRGRETLGRLELIRVSDRILAAAGDLRPPELRTPDAIHLATAQELGTDLARLITYDERLGSAGAASGIAIGAPR